MGHRTVQAPPGVPGREGPRPRIPGPRTRSAGAGCAANAGNQNAQSGDLTLGGQYRLHGNAHGTIERCDPPNGCAATWEWEQSVSWIELRLTPETDGRTRFEVDHIAHVDDDTKWPEYGPGAVGVGWDIMVMCLYLHLSTGRPVDPQKAEAFMASDEGKRFVEMSSEGWYEANVASGQDPATARAAADATTAAYTGAEAPPES